MGCLMSAQPVHCAACHPDSGRHGIVPSDSRCPGAWEHCRQHAVGCRRVLVRHSRCRFRRPPGCGLLFRQGFRQRLTRHCAWRHAGHHAFSSRQRPFQQRPFQQPPFWPLPLFGLLPLWPFAQLPHGPCVRLLRVLCVQLPRGPCVRLPRVLCVQLPHGPCARLLRALCVQLPHGPCARLLRALCVPLPHGPCARLLRALCFQLPPVPCAPRLRPLLVPLPLTPC